MAAVRSGPPSRSCVSWRRAATSASTSPTSSTNTAAKRIGDLLREKQARLGVIAPEKLKEVAALQPDFLFSRKVLPHVAEDGLARYLANVASLMAVKTIAVLDNTPMYDNAGNLTGPPPQRGGDAAIAPVRFRNRADPIRRRAAPPRLGQRDCTRWRPRVGSAPSSSARNQAMPSPAARPSGRSVDQLRQVELLVDVQPLCRRLLPRQVRQHPCALHRDPRGEGAILPQGQRQGLGHRRIRHAAGARPTPAPTARPRRASSPAAPRRSSA